MFESLSNKFSSVFDRLNGKKSLSVDDVNKALREIRLALLEADVALPVVKNFLDMVREQAVGEDVIKSVKAGEMVVKIVHDQLVELLGGEAQDIQVSLTKKPSYIMFVGLQGSGKTTSSAKLANYLKKNFEKKVLLVSLDTYRPAAQEQLRVLGEQVDIDVLTIVPNQSPLDITKRAMAYAKNDYDCVILDTAGRLHIDAEMMGELHKIKALANPDHTYLVSDAMSGQDVVESVQAFHDELDLTGSILTRIDGDARGGAALSIRHITGCPIVFLGVGEKMADIEQFHPDRIAKRILGMGDIVSLVEKASATIEEDEAKKMAEKMQKGKFDLEDFLKQIKQLTNLGGIGSIINMLPGAGKIKQQMAQSKFNEDAIKKQEALILSMTLEERRHPEIIKASRKKRIAEGAGMKLQDVNKLLKQFEKMNKMMKRFGKMDKSQLMESGLGDFLPKN